MCIKDLWKLENKHPNGYFYQDPAEGCSIQLVLIGPFGSSILFVTIGLPTNQPLVRAEGPFGLMITFCDHPAANEQPLVTNGVLMKL